MTIRNSVAEDGAVVSQISHNNEMDPAEFRTIMSSFPSGVLIVTALDADSQPRGLTAIAFCSISLTPPTSLVCIGKQSNTWPAIESSGKFVVNFLQDGQEEVAQRFASKAEDKFASVDWTPGHVTGHPVLAGVVAYTENTIEKVVDAGDHWIVISRVEAGAVRPNANPLVYCRRTFRGWV